jgi:tetratricopeptide (TPR) repeat protein
MNPWVFFRKAVEGIERQKFSLFFGFLGLFSIITIRNIFEGSFEGAQTLGFSPVIERSFYMMFTHFPLFYMSIFLWFVIVLTIMTRENVCFVSKAALFGMSVIVITPFVDIVVSRGSGYTLTYLRGMEQFAKAYRFFDLTQEIIESSWGQRMEIVLALLGGFAYVLLKTKNIWKSAASAVLFYLIILLHGALPNTISKLPSYLGYRGTTPLTLLSGGLLPVDSQNYSVIFILSCLAAGLLLLKRLNKGVLHRLFNFRITIVPMLLFFLGVLYGLLRLSQYYTTLFFNPMIYLVIITAFLTVHLVLIAAKQKTLDSQVLLLLLFITFSAMALGPVFLLGIAILYSAVRFSKVRIISALLPVLIGFSIIFQKYAIVSFLPVSKGMAEGYCRNIYAWNLFLDKKYSLALEEYKKTSLSGQNQETQKRIGQCTLRTGEMGQGIRILEEIRPQDYETLTSLADAYAMTGQLDRAVAVCDLAVRRNIEPAEFLIRSARLYARAGNETQTKTDLKKAIKYGAARYVYFEVMGDFYLAKKQLDIAQARYLEALGFNHRSVAAFSGLATVFYYRGDYREAERGFLRALKIEPANDALYNNLGAIYLLTGDYQKAAAVFEMSVRINASQVEGYYNLGLVAEKTGDPNKAIAMYRKALSINAVYRPAKQALERLGVTND